MQNGEPAKIKDSLEYVPRGRGDAYTKYDIHDSGVFCNTRYATIIQAKSYSYYHSDTDLNVERSMTNYDSNVTDNF